MTSADSVRRLEMQNFGLVFSCGVLSELDGVGTPSATPFLWSEPVAFRRVHGITRLPRHDRGPVPGGIDPRLAVYAES